MLFLFFNFSIFSCSFFFSWVLKIFFCLDCLTISYSSPYVKTIFSGPSRGVTPWQFFSCLFFHFFIFVFSFNFFPCFSFFFIFHFFLFFFLFSGAQNLFVPRLPYDFLFKPLCKNIFLGRLGGNSVGQFFSCLFFHFFIFVFFFNFFPCFSFVFPFSFFPLFSFCFPFFFRCFFLFHFVSLFSFLGCSKSVAALQDSLGKMHILSWLYLLCIGSS